jgi:hypothetical protein
MGLAKTHFPRAFFGCLGEPLTEIELLPHSVAFGQLFAKMHNKKLRAEN